jgi:Leucine-rich repeat (LRR) protein
MNKLLLVFLLTSFMGYAQKTYIPDDAFEQALINLDLDDIFDDSVYTSAVDTIETLYLSNSGISDLTGIKDFILLADLFCNGNQIIDLDLSNNSNLFELNCSNNLLSSLDLRNGNNTGLWYFNSLYNPQLFCIAVNDIAYANYNWLKDSGSVFSTNCGISFYEDSYGQKKTNKNIGFIW